MHLTNQNFMKNGLRASVPDLSGACLNSGSDNRHFPIRSLYM